MVKTVEQMTVEAPDFSDAQNLLRTSMIRPGHAIYTNADGIVLLVRPGEEKREGGLKIEGFVGLLPDPIDSRYLINLVVSNDRDMPRTAGLLPEFDAVGIGKEGIDIIRNNPNDALAFVRGEIARRRYEAAVY